MISHWYWYFADEYVFEVRRAAVRGDNQTEQIPIPVNATNGLLLRFVLPA